MHRLLIVRVRRWLRDGLRATWFTVHVRLRARCAFRSDRRHGWAVFRCSLALFSFCAPVAVHGHHENEYTRNDVEHATPCPSKDRMATLTPRFFVTVNGRRCNTRVKQHARVLHVHISLRQSSLQTPSVQSVLVRDRSRSSHRTPKRISAYRFEQPRTVQ